MRLAEHFSTVLRRNFTFLQVSLLEKKLETLVHTIMIISVADSRGGGGALVNVTIWLSIEWFRSV